MAGPCGRDVCDFKRNCPAVLEMLAPLSIPTGRVGTAPQPLQLLMLSGLLFLASWWIAVSPGGFNFPNN